MKYKGSKKRILLKTVKNLFFKVITIAGIVYVPIHRVVRHICPKIVWYIANLVWYAWVIIYFCVFFIILWSCANAITRIRLRPYDKDILVRRAGGSSLI